MIYEDFMRDIGELHPGYQPGLESGHQSGYRSGYQRGNQPEVIIKTSSEFDRGITGTPSGYHLDMRRRNDRSSKLWIRRKD